MKTSHKTRNSFIDSDLIDKLPFFLIETVSKRFSDHRMIEAKIKDFSIINILKILYAIGKNNVDGYLKFTDLFIHSRIRMKSSYLNYLQFCKEFRLIQKNDHGMGYSMTEKGEFFLDFFIKSNPTY